MYLQAIVTKRIRKQIGSACILYRHPISFQSLEKCFVSVSETIAQTNGNSYQLGILNVMVLMVTQNVNKFIASGPKLPAVSIIKGIKLGLSARRTS